MTMITTTTTSTAMILVLGYLTSPSAAFLPHSAIAPLASVTAPAPSIIAAALPDALTDAIISNQNLDVMQSSTTTSLLLSDEGGIVDIIRNIAVAITAVVFLLAGLTFLTASVLVPAAAKELEKECLELAPELWAEYQQRLEPGQTMGQRPDLMQELGAKLQPLVDAKVEQQFAAQKAKGIDVSEDEKAWRAIDNFNDKIPKPNSPFGDSSAGPSSPDLPTVGGQWDDDGGAIDAEVISKTTDKK